MPFGNPLGQLGKLQLRPACQQPDQSASAWCDSRLKLAEPLAGLGADEPENGFVNLRTILGLCGLSRSGLALEFGNAFDNSALGEIVWRDLDYNLVARQNADIKAAHLSSEVCQEFMPVIAHNAECRVGKTLLHYAVHFDSILSH